MHDKVGKNDYNLIEYDIEVEKAYFEVFFGQNFVSQIMKREVDYAASTKTIRNI